MSPLDPGQKVPYTLGDTYQGPSSEVLPMLDSKGFLIGNLRSCPNGWHANRLVVRQGWAGFDGRYPFVSREAAEHFVHTGKFAGQFPNYRKGA